MSASKLSPWIAGLFVVLIWSTSFSFTRNAVLDIGIWQFRLYSAVVALLPLISFIPYSFRTIKRSSLKDRLFLLVVVFINGSLVATVNIVSLAYLDASTVLALIYTMPAFAGIIEAAYSRSLKFSTFAAPALAAVGVVIYNGTVDLDFGFIAVLCNAAVWGLATFLTGRIAKDISSRDRVVTQCVVSLVFSLICFALWSVVSNQQLIVPSTRAVIGVLYAGVLNGAVVFWLWYVAVSGLGAAKAAYLTLLVPICGAVFAWMFFGETMTFTRIIGVLVICSSMLVKFTARE